MADRAAASSSDTFTSFGELLRYLRRRQRLTQIDLAIATGYSTGQISRLEQNQRLPNPDVIHALFVPALELEREPELVAKLLALAQHAYDQHTPSVAAPDLVPADEIPRPPVAVPALPSSSQLPLPIVRTKLYLPLRARAAGRAAGSGRAFLVRRGGDVSARGDGPRAHRRCHRCTGNPHGGLDRRIAADGAGAT